MSIAVSPNAKPSFLGTLRRHAVRCAVAAGLLAAAGCTSADRAAPPEADRQVDPLSLGHAAWCGMNPPSGYCATRERL